MFCPTSENILPGVLPDRIKSRIFESTSAANLAVKAAEERD